MLGITNLRNGMILSTLNISSRDFAFGFSKKPMDVFFTYKPMINSLISRCETPLPTVLNRSVHWKSPDQVDINISVFHWSAHTVFSENKIEKKLESYNKTESLLLKSHITRTSQNKAENITMS